MLVNMSGGKVEEITEVVEPVLLWTNPSPTASFAAQTVDVNGAEYSGYIVEFCRTTSATSVRGTCYVAKGISVSIGAGIAIGSPYVLSARMITATTDSGITFTAGSTGDNQSNSDAIPTRIWGVKFTL